MADEDKPTRREIRHKIEDLSLESLKRAPTVFSYNYGDVATGQTLVSFQAGTARDDTATEQRIIFTSTFESETTTHSGTRLTNVGGVIKVADHDYNFVMGVASIVKGVAIAAVKHSVTAGGSTALNSHVDGESYVIIKIRKYDGSTETEIGSGKTSTLDEHWDGGTGSSTTSKRSTLYINCTETFLQPTDILRVTVELWAEMTFSEDADINYVDSTYLTNPTDAGVSDLPVIIPFKLGTTIN